MEGEAAALAATRAPPEDIRRIRAALEAIDEALDVARSAGVSLQISHFKVTSPNHSYFNDMGMPKLLRSVEKVDDYTVRFKFPDPYPMFVEKLAGARPREDAATPGPS